MDIAIPPDCEEQLRRVSLEVVLEEGGRSNLFSSSSVNGDGSIMDYLAILHVDHPFTSRMDPGLSSFW